MISSRTTTVIVLAWMLGLPQWSHASNISANDAFRAIRKITTSEGIEQQEIITIGGVPQWISIRARDRNAPILLVLHGGPASRFLR